MGEIYEFASIFSNKLGKNQEKREGVDNSSYTEQNSSYIARAKRILLFPRGKHLFGFYLSGRFSNFKAGRYQYLLY